MSRLALLLTLALATGTFPAPARAETQVDVSTGIILLKDGTNPASRYVKWKSRTKLDPVANQVVPPAPRGTPHLVPELGAVCTSADPGSAARQCSIILR